MSNDKAKAAHRLKCDDIRELLIEYFLRELGQNRSDLVREHLRKCEDCRAAAAELSDTVDLLRSTMHDPEEPQRLSDESRRRILHAISHPLLDWMSRHHALVSTVVVIITLLVAGLLLRDIRIRRDLPEAIEVEVLKEAVITDEYYEE